MSPPTASKHATTYKNRFGVEIVTVAVSVSTAMSREPTNSHPAPPEIVMSVLFEPGLSTALTPAPMKLKVGR